MGEYTVWKKCAKSRNYRDIPFIVIIVFSANILYNVNSFYPKRISVFGHIYLTETEKPQEESKR